jgi:hypothetical protein
MNDCGIHLHFNMQNHEPQRAQRNTKGRLPELPNLPKIAEIEKQNLPRIYADECGSEKLTYGEQRNTGHVAIIFY